jgi:hypothetical protein
MIFVLEIKETGVLAFEADTIDAARAYARNAGEREDLKELRSSGAPLWNGTDVIGRTSPMPTRKISSFTLCRWTNPRTTERCPFPFHGARLAARWRLRNARASADNAIVLMP